MIAKNKIAQQQKKWRSFGKATMNNLVRDWSWERPTKEGLYLVCLGDIETKDNIFPVRLVAEKPDGDYFIHDWPCHTAADLRQWSDSFKFARLDFG